MWKFSLRVEFQVQLKAIEEFLSSVPEKLFSKLRDQYLEELTQSMTQIQHRFELVQQQSEQKRVCKQMQNNGNGRGNDPVITLPSSSHVVILRKKPLNCHNAILLLFALDFSKKLFKYMHP